MAILKILQYPNPLLKKKCEKVDQIDNKIKSLIDNMVETMYDANGIGLAASQVGILQRVIVIDVSPMEPEKGLLVMINPEIISEEGDIEYEEGCLSLPEFREKVKRKEKVKVMGISPEGKEIITEADGILAIAFQHEIDHLNGILLLDRVSRLKREIYKNKLRKEKEGRI
jgi:peptide deformylase